MTNYTPGPWAVNRVSKSTILKDLYVSAGPERIARIVVPATAKSIQEYESNARLIAAAPDLLELSKAFLDALDRDLPHDMKHHAAGERFNLRLAIAKAIWG